MRQKKNIAHTQKALHAKTLAKISLCVMLVMLMLCNIIVFAKSMNLSDNILTLENDISRMRKENQELLKKTYATSSLVSLEYAAKELGFTKKAEPVFFEKPNYAMAQ